MKVENEFTAALAALCGPGGVEPNESGEYAFKFAGVPLKAVCSPETPDEVRCYAKVGSLAGIEDPGALLTDMLEANFFWIGNAGSTVAVIPGTDDVLLQDRREAGYFADAETLKGYLAAFADKATMWSGHIEEYRAAVAEKPEGEEAQS